MCQQNKTIQNKAKQSTAQRRQAMTESDEQQRWTTPTTQPQHNHAHHRQKRTTWERSKKRCQISKTTNGDTKLESRTRSGALRLTFTYQTDQQPKNVTQRNIWAPWQKTSHKKRVCTPVFTCDFHPQQSDVKVSTSMRRKRVNHTQMLTQTQRLAREIVHKYCLPLLCCG